MIYIYIYIFFFYYLFIYFLLNCTNDILYDNDLFKTNFLEISKHALKFKVMHWPLCDRWISITEHMKYIYIYRERERC